MAASRTLRPHKPVNKATVTDDAAAPAPSLKGRKRKQDEPVVMAAAAVGKKGRRGAVTVNGPAAAEEAPGDDGGEDDNEDDADDTGADAAPAASSEPKAKKAKRLPAYTQPVPSDMPTNTSMPKEYHIDPVDSNSIKIVSYNVASLFAALSKGLKPYILAENADILCMQETKHKSDALPQNLLPNMEQETWNAPEHKKGYSGTAVLSKLKPLNATKGIGVPQYDDEGRVITHEYDDFFLVSTYVPNSGQKLERLPYRQEWDEAMLEYLKTLDKVKPVIWTGDLNVAYEEIDLARPGSNKRTAGFTREERENFGKVLGSGFVDAFRHFNPDKPGQYTYWGMRSGGRAKGIGWRLDYFIVSERLLPRVKSCLIRAEAYGASDHVPIVLILEK